MASIINASTSTGLVTTADTSGVLQLQTGGTAAVSIGTDQSFNFSATGQRITGDFSNATVASRVAFQTSTANSNTIFTVLPVGTGSGTFTEYYQSGTDPANSSLLSVGLAGGAGVTRINSTITGTGTYLPMTFFTGGSESLRLSATTKAVILAGGSTSANGTGITFPAVFNASSDVNTLDDYEEGSWSPTFSGFTIGNATATAYEYVKIGRICLATVSFIWGSTSTSSGDWGITLPFTAANSGGGAAYALDNGSAEYAFSVIVATGTYGSTIRIGDGTGAGLLGGTSPFTWASGDRFQLGVTYMTA